MPAARRVLVLGGGDGLAVREVLALPGGGVGHPGRSRSGDDAAVRRRIPLLRRLNARRAARSARARGQRGRVRLADRARRDAFDVVVVDFPDPHNFSLGKLYTTHASTAMLAAAGWRPGGVWWCRPPRRCSRARRSGASSTTLSSAGFWPRAVPRLRAVVRRVGLRAGRRPRPGRRRARYPAGLRFLTVDATPALFAFPPDMAAGAGRGQPLDNQMLVHYYGAEWQRWN